MQVKDVAYTQVICVWILLPLTHIYKQVSYRILVLGFALFPCFHVRVCFVVGVFFTKGEGRVHLFSSINTK